MPKVRNELWISRTEDRQRMVTIRVEKGVRGKERAFKMSGVKIENNSQIMCVVDEHSPKTIEFAVDVPWRERI
jgi:hypothetical protein